MNYQFYYRKALTTVLFLFLLSSSIYSQPKKFGDIHSSEFFDYNTEYDSSMSAIILFEKGEVEFDDDYNCILEIHRRVKILNDEGFEYGDIEVPIYKDAKQDVYSIKAVTYTLQPNGTIEEKKLGRKDVFETEVREDLNVKKFTMPALSPGVIIEYSYKKKMGNPFYLPDWKFHAYVPVKWSEYKMTIPLTLNYQMIFKGSDSLHINEVNKITNSGTLFTSSSGGAQQIYLAKKDLPPVEELPFLINREDHVSEVLTQLNSVRIPGSIPQNFYKDWQSIANELNDRGDFGKQKVNGEIRDQIKELITDDLTDLKKVEVIYNYLAYNFEWDGFHRLVTEKGIRDTFKDKKGNTADINLLLIEMLREAGVKASPALISTRTNGNVITNYPIINQFNIVVAAVETGNSAFIVDASSGRRAFTFPHPKILYRDAFVVREDNSYGWLTTFPIDKTFERLSMSYSLADSSRIPVELAGNVKGAYAEDFRQDVKGINFNEYWEDAYSELRGLEVDSSTFKNLEKLSGNVSYETSFSFDKDPDLSLDQDIIYLKPFLFLRVEENPFKKPTREFPVEFPHPFSKQHMVKVELPEGYVIEEMPENRQYALDNNDAYYRFMVSVNGSTLTMVSTINVKSVYYTPEDYPSIKELFQHRVDALSAVVVLKKEGSE